MKQCRLGYEKLNLDEKLVYDNLLNAFITFSDSVDSNRFKKNIDLMKVLNVVVGDNPSIIHFNKSQIKLSSSMFSGKQIKLCGTYSRSQINKIYSELESKVEFALNEIELLNPITIYDKLICIYEYLQDNVTYDEQEWKTKNNKLAYYLEHDELEKIEKANLEKIIEIAKKKNSKRT